MLKHDQVGRCERALLGLDIDIEVRIEIVERTPRDEGQVADRSEQLAIGERLFGIGMRIDQRDVRIGHRVLAVANGSEKI